MMLLDYFGFLVGFLEKGTKSVNLGNFGVQHHGVGIPRSSVGPRQGVAEREFWIASGTRGVAKLRYGVALFTIWKFLCFILFFCYLVIPRTCLFD